MLVSDLKSIGEKLRKYRKMRGMTQAETAEAAELSDRTYADIERGTANARLETLVKICAALHITPNDILTDNLFETQSNPKELLERLNLCPEQEKKTALRLLAVYLDSIEN